MNEEVKFLNREVKFLREYIKDICTYKGLPQELTYDVPLQILEKICLVFDYLQQENKQLKEENKKLNNIFDEIEDYMDDVDYKMGWQYANKLRELKGSDKE